MRSYCKGEKEMKIIWDNIHEIGKYIRKFGLEKICEDEYEWGGRGYIIASGGYLSDKKKISSEESVSRPGAGGGDTIIMTPYAKELSWLFRNLMNYAQENNKNVHLVEESVWVASAAFFVEHKQYNAEQLIEYVYDFVCNIFDRDEQPNRTPETFWK